MQIKFTKQAFADIDVIYEHIAVDSVATAKKIILHIEQTVDYIGDFPEMGRKSIVKNVREMVVPHSPLSIIYEIKDDTLYILTIFHSARDRRNNRQLQKK